MSSSLECKNSLLPHSVTSSNVTIFITHVRRLHYESYANAKDFVGPDLGLIICKVYQQTT